ncbi:hypothetical protein INT45_011126 [Circinella minor]|uniref:Uncharacterized protein n=1 Tax=Circinella minor TaxID=1195481 RepID=A0A8H7SF70_9FUNG|nr:hypothetical protein INT45_011126 [Circinella minor]
MFEHHTQFQQVYNNDNDNASTRIYTLDRSPHYHLISKVIQHRRLRQQEKSCTSFTPTSSLRSKKKNTTTIDTNCMAVENGLPSPPVDGHFKLTPNSFTSTTTPLLPTTTTTTTTIKDHDSFMDNMNKKSLSKADICIKLQELRDEKHRLFQLIKQQLVLQEEQERRASQEYYIQQQQQHHYIS